MFGPDQILQNGNLLAMVGWVILILGPRQFRAVYWLPKFVIPGLLSVGYAGLLLPNFFASEGGFGSIEEIRLLFASDHLLAAGWLHYLAFDLFVGAWIAKASDEAGISRIIQFPILLATFMFGPIGLLLFILTRTIIAGFPQKSDDAFGEDA